MVDRHVERTRSRDSERVLAALTARRHYALFLGASLWLLMVGRVVLEGGRWTRDALPLGWDFHVFRSAGAIVAQGLGADLYDDALLERVAKQALPGDYPVFGYLNPPHFAVAFTPLAFLPHALAFALFTSLSLVLLFGALSLLERRTRGTRGAPSRSWIALGYALSSYPVIVGLFAGQNCFLSLWLVAMACVLALEGKAFGSGCAVGALLYKPQLALGLLVFFALHRPLRRRALAGFFTALALSLAASLLVSLDASRAYFGMLGDLPDAHTRFRLALAFTGRAAFEQLLPEQPRLAALLGAALSLGCVLAYGLWARRERDVAVLLAGAVWLTLAATPHAWVYEWTLLIVPLMLLRRELDERAWTLVAALLFVTSYVSPTLTEATTDHFGFGVQVAVMALFVSAWHAVRSLRASRARRMAA